MVKPATKPNAPATPDTDTCENDIIEDIFAAVIAMAPQFTAELEKIKYAKRQQWGGDRPYISLRPGDSRSPRNQRIIEMYARGERPEHIARVEKMSRSNVHRILELNKKM